MTSGRVLLIRAGSRGQGSSYVTAGLVRTARAQQQRVLAIDAAAPTGNLADLLEIPHATPFAVFAHAPTELLDRVTHNASGVAVLPLTDGVSELGPLLQIEAMVQLSLERFTPGKGAR